MVELQRGDIVQADAEALVNTVNCVGVMGRGIALQFRKAFPENYRKYKAACDRGQLHPGSMLVHDRNQLENPRFIINFPTKRHWRGRSRLEDIDKGLIALVADVQRLGIRSIAVPPLGCGLGGLDWSTVRPRIEAALEQLPDLTVLLFEPGGAPPADVMVKVQVAPRMTVGRAVLLGLMRRYLGAVMDPEVSLLEIHKLMYFMQEAGEPLRLQFRKAKYGPYAKNLRHVLNQLEGHYVRGFGDAADSPEKPIELLPEATDRSEKYLSSHEVTRARFDRVARLIGGFETPYGMELLATVHWIATRDDPSTPEEVVEGVYGWGTRKRMFSKSHIGLALLVLESQDWLPAVT